MTDPESTEKLTDTELPHSAPEVDGPTKPTTAEAEAEAEPEAEPEPEPEPWTPERVLEWNAYYDIYVTLGVVLLVFVASANKITTSVIWTQLQAGRLMIERSAPLLTDPFSYTEQGQRWTNVSWLFDWSHALLHKSVREQWPIDRNDLAGSEARADQVAAGSLVALDALARTFTVLFLLGIRRRGPGLWWTAVVATLALGAILAPGSVSVAGLAALVALGGMAGPAAVAPATWGVLLLALELFLLHRAWNLERPSALFGLIPVFLLWANLDDTFLIGLLILALAVVGRLVRPPARETGIVDKGGYKVDTSAPKAARELGVLGVCALVCLLNPSTYRVYGAGLEPFLQLVRPSSDVMTLDQLSYFGAGLRAKFGAGANVLLGYYLVLAALGFASFALNGRRFSLSRFLVYTFAVVLWGAFIRYSAEFAIVFAATVALNGQEWYHDRFGLFGRVGRGWSAWSVGGRAVTIVLISAFVAKGLTGWGKTYGDPLFGFAYNPDDFAFEAAEMLRDAPIEGRILNTIQSQGDALIWRAYPKRQTYIDGREHLFPPKIMTELQAVRSALSKDDVAVWKPFFDEYKISAVMIEPVSAPRTYQRLSQSLNWIPFYDDGSAVVFGRADAPSKDLAYFKAHRLSAERLVYRESSPVPSFTRPPTPVGPIDEYFEGRFLARAQPHTLAAAHWLQGADSEALADPARCLLAIREARRALAAKPDDSQAFRVLRIAYRNLMQQEAALLDDVALTASNQVKITHAPLKPAVQMTRFRERVTALSYAIQTSRTPRTPEARRDLQSLNLELVELYLLVNFRDLARDRLQAVLDKAGPDDYPRELKLQLSKQLSQLVEHVRQVEDELRQQAEQQQAGPLQRAAFALNNGAPGLAIQELEEADRTGSNPAIVRPQLVDLYCDTGQPDKALELMSSNSIEDPSFGMEPGVSAYRQGTVYFLLGNYPNASTLWEDRSIPRIRADRVSRALTGGGLLVRGNVQSAVSTELAVPAKVNTQATWEYELAMCQLEAGQPAQAAEHFTEALTLSPEIPTRPIIAYYLKKLGKAVPPQDAHGSATTSEAVKPTPESRSEPLPKKD